MCKRPTKETLGGLPLQSLRLPLSDLQEGTPLTSPCPLGEFGDSPRYEMITNLDPLRPPRQPVQLLSCSTERTHGSIDEFGDSPRDRVLAYLDGDDSASPWHTRDPPQLPNLLSAQHTVMPAARSRKTGRRSKRQVVFVNKEDSDSASTKDTIGADGSPRRERPAQERRVANPEAGSEDPPCLGSEIPRYGSEAAASFSSESPCFESETSQVVSTSSVTAASPPTAADATVGMDGNKDSEGIAAAADWPETATTVMLRNIPNRYTVEELIAEMLAAGFEASFDFFYLPIDFNTKRNRGYAFINFRAPSDAQKFVATFHRQRLTRYATQKILEVSPALTQGLDANIAQFVKKDAQRIQNPWFRPMIFNRDGEDRALAQTAR